MEKSRSGSLGYMRENGLGLHNFEQVQSSMQIKFAWRLMFMDNLWTNLFKAKYIKQSHLDLFED